MASRISAVDPGSHSLKAMTIKAGKHGLSMERFVSLPSNDPDLSGLGLSLKSVVLGLAGRDMTLRFTQVPPAPDWQLRKLMELEIDDLKAQTGDDLSADFNLLPIEDEEGGMETVLLAIAKNRGLEQHSELVSAAGGSVACHVPNCVALYNAFLSCGPVEEDLVTCLVNIGHESTDIAIVNGMDLLFVRNLSSGGKVFDEAISSAFNVGARKAQELKRDLLDLDPASRGRYASGQAEKVTMAAGGAGSMIVSAIQSSIAFCRSQARMPDLEIDRLLLSGGSARTRGLKGMLLETLRCPVEYFDPYDSVDLSALPPEDAENLEQMRFESVIALGLCAGKLDESLYELEILPESLKRRRRFMRRGIFNYAAGLSGVLLLAGLATSDSSRLDDAQRSASLVRRQESRLRKTHEDAAELVASNAEAQRLVAGLSARALPLNSILLTLRGLEQTMPPEGWLDSLELRKSGSRSAQDNVVVIVKGRIKGVFGGDVGEVYRKFLNDFKNWDFEGYRPDILPESDTSNRNETLFTWQVDMLAEAEGEDG
ncbi:MAG: pilus assembly protein PilM [Planctomycetota bacterium]|jgi:Tfp pilus assembly PilM family ATPase